MKVNEPLMFNKNFQCIRCQGFTSATDKRELPSVTAGDDSSKSS